MIRRIWAVGYKEVLHGLRDVRTLTALVIMPGVLLLIYGFALSFDVEHVRLGVVDLDGSPAARTLVDRFVAGPTFHLVRYSRDIRDLDAWFDAFEVQAALVIPKGYGAALAAGTRVDIAFVADGSDSRTATTVLAYGHLAASMASPDAYEYRGKGRIVPRPLVWYNPSLRSSLFLVPGLLAFILTITSVVATALSVVREKERGTIETLRATPLRPGELVLGKTVPYLILGIIAAVLELLVAHLLFEVPVQGSLMWLLVVTVLFLLAGLGWGLFISTVADSQQVAFQLALLSTLLPTLLLSGFIFPISSMPKAIQLVTTIIPARYFLAALRDIVLKGTGPSEWWDQLAALAAFAGGILTLAIIRTRRGF
ncbi:MAG: ABC transporter permease [Thermoanaerobaculum sp.]